MTDLIQLLDYTNEWYHNDIPRFGTTKFNTFVLKSLGLAHQICFPEKATIGLCEGDTPYVIHDDPRKPSKIFVPRRFFAESFYSEVMDPADFDLISGKQFGAWITSVLNGVVVHEAAHIELSPDTLEELLLAVPSYRRKDFTDTETNMLLQIANCVEDVFIETSQRERRPALTPFLLSIAALFFGSEQNQITAFDLLQEDSPLKLMDIVIRWKSLHFRDCIADLEADYSDRVKETVRLIRLAEDASLKQSDRGQIAIDIFNRFRETSSNEEMEELLGPADQVDDRISKMMPIPMDGIGQKTDISNSSEAGESESSDESESKQIEAIGIVMEASDKYEEQEAEAKAKEVRIAASKVENIPIIKVKDVSELKRPKEFDLDDRFKMFGTYLKLIRTKNHTVGAPKRSGPVLVKNRLHRIGTDGKIFAQRDFEMKTKRDAETIILIDMSGSMTRDGSLNKKSRIGHWQFTLFEEVLAAAHGAFVSLQESNLSCGVYGHTTATHDEPIIYHIASYRMRLTTTDNLRRFQLAAGISMNSNFDGLAIEEAAKNFTTNDREKILVVMSDGQPNGINYHGEAAHQHVIAVNTELRKRGIHVYSMSLVNEVVPANNKLYGEKFNINATGNISEVLKQFVLKIVNQ